MRKITDFIVEKRYIILVVFLFITGICLYTSTKVNINFDITRYLPNDSETKIGKDIMDNDFEQLKSSELNVMFKDLSKNEKKEILKKLKKVKGVDSVEYSNAKEYNKDGYTLYKLNVADYDHSKKSKEVYEYVKDNFKVTAFSGSIYDENKPVLQLWIVILAISMAMIILIIMSSSYVEPFLYLLAIGIAVFINKGTNIMFNSVSNITDSITAILQLALSMDYSIMLSNRYRQEKKKTKNNEKAMKEALFESFKSISSSSITTIVGLIALVFMSFTIGKDLGFVLAKGVLLSLISIFFCLPGLLLIFDKLIKKTSKKEPRFNLEKLGGYVYKTRKPQLVLIILVFIISIFLKGNLKILYTGSEQDEVGKVFDKNNQIAVIYDNKYENIVADYCTLLENDKNIDQVLCYGNTLNQKLTYDKLNQKLSDLGQDTKIDEELIKIIYYNYYNKNIKNKMTINEFINFVKTDIYTSSKFNSKIDDNIKNNIDKLSNFTSESEINKKRSYEEIANLLQIDIADAKNLLIYYNSKNIDNKMTIEEFVRFMNNDVMNDSEYSKDIDLSTKNSLNQLKVFTDKSLINKEMTSKEISSILGIDSNLVEQLFLFYNVNYESKTKMTINEFTKFILSSEEYKSLVDENTLNLLKILNKLSDKYFINEEYKSSEMNLFKLLNIEEESVDKLYLFYTSLNQDNKMTISEFVNKASMLSNSPAFKDNFSEASKESINSLKTLLSYSNTPLDKDHLYQMFKTDTLTYQMVEMLVSTYGTNNLMTPAYFVNILSNIITNEEELNNLNKIKLMIDNKDTEFKSNEISSIMQEDTTLVNIIYSVDEYKNTKVSSKELIKFIIENKDNELLKSNLEGYMDKILLADTIINNIENEFDYKELSSLLSIDESKIKSIYGLYNYNNKETKMSLYKFINMILSNKENALLKGKITNDTVYKLNLLSKVMDSTTDNKTYSASELSNLLKIDSEKLDLLYSLYDFKYIKSNENISVLEFTDFIINDVMENAKYNSKFDDEAKDKLNTINGIMKSALLSYKYNSLELTNILSKLSDGLSSDLVDLVYIYHGSVKKYDDNYNMTIEEFINYLNDSILTDKRFDSFINKDMKNKITSAKEKITDSKKLLVTDKYSRAIFNTKYASEDNKTFKFIKQTLDKLGKNDGIYVIGDSPMAYEMSKSFGNELDFITILTILFIFIVVAITFKSILIPLVLILIIQTAVFLTMGILSLMGGSVYFISLLIVQAILMGATIDYAIVYTSYYLESRKKMDVKKSIINAYNKSIHTILTSSSILIIVTLIVANFASAIAAKICETLSQGTLASALLILFILPGVLSTFDKFICKEGKR